MEEWGYIKEVMAAYGQLMHGNTWQQMVLGTVGFCIDELHTLGNILLCISLRQRKIITAYSFRYKLQFNRFCGKQLTILPISIEWPSPEAKPAHTLCSNFGSTLDITSLYYRGHFLHWFNSHLQPTLPCFFLSFFIREICLIPTFSYHRCFEPHLGSRGRCCIESTPAPKQQ